MVSLRNVIHTSTLTALTLCGACLPITAMANENQTAMANQISTICSPDNATGGSILESDSCLAFQQLNDPQPFAAQVTPDETPAQYTSLVQISSNQISNISQHLNGRRQQQNGQAETTAMVYPQLDQYVGGSAGGGLFSNGRISVFFSGASVDGSQDDTDFEEGYDLSGDHYTLGLDLQLNSEWLVGIAYGVTATELEYNLFEDQTDNDSDHLLIYSSWYRKSFAVDMTLGYASGEFKTLRHLPDADAEGKTDNNMFYLSITGSFDFNQGGLSYGPLSGLDYLNGKIDAFEEQGDSVWNAAFDSQDVESMIFYMGGQTSYAQSFSWGVIVPFAKALWRYEMEEDRDLIVGRFASAPAEQFTITPDDPDTSWYEVSAGVSAVFPHGISAFISYEEIVSYEDTDLATFSAGARLEF